ncbi:biliverdin-producing heme oxygenase [Rhizobium sp. LjRoot30]|uniref:biliverdin-producing heme oxygenase n=1 Tax=Rhizobium sp. LjRoot30 TaxID=3342320 RepID=UPI003ECC7261
MGHSERRFALRDRTRANHEKLDTAIGAFENLAAYRRYVTFLGRFRFAMDRVLNDVVWPRDWSWRPTAVSDSIAQDAKDLGLRVTPTETSDVLFDDQSGLLGAIYVLEGSTLGARVLRSRAAALGMTDGFGARHLAVMTRDMSCWQAFLRQLDGVEDFDIECAAQAANAVFDLALRCVETGGLPSPDFKASAD